MDSPGHNFRTLSCWVIASFKETVIAPTVTLERLENHEKSFGFATTIVSQSPYDVYQNFHVPDSSPHTSDNLVCPLPDIPDDNFLLPSVDPTEPLCEGEKILLTCQTQGTWNKFIVKHSKASLPPFISKTIVIFLSGFPFGVFSGGVLRLQPAVLASVRRRLASVWC